VIIQTDKPLRERHPQDFYPTPMELCRAALQFAFEDWEVQGTVRGTLFTVDPGAGDGVWGRALKSITPYSHICGVELRDVPPPQARTYDEWNANCDFLSHYLKRNYDLVMGNPPYKHAEEFIRRSMACLRNGGRMVYLLRLNFIAGQARGTGLWQEMPPMKIGVSCRRPSFTGDGRTDATEYAVFVWERGWQGKTQLDWLNWQYAE
jgi:hypothetical protein